MSDMTTQTRRTYTRWTPTEIETLRANASEGSAAVAKLLGRSEAQIKTKATSLGISLRKTGSKAGRKMREAQQ